ncbi:MAG: hypothetical protein L7S64_11895 [Longimicrobiales bacterium]|nr:hypothetical protein [Longimicrobiales bacterium]
MDELRALQDEQRRLRELVAEQNRVHEERMAEMRAMVAEASTLAADEAVRKAQDLRAARKRGTIQRQANRAGMTLTAWIDHCNRIGHDPTKMDRNIENHEPAHKRGGGRRKKGDDVRALAEANVDMSERFKQEGRFKK